MSRKTKRCVATKFESMTRMRTCILDRGHEGKHLDEHGRWEEPK